MVDRRSWLSTFGIAVFLCAPAVHADRLDTIVVYGERGDRHLSQSTSLVQTVEMDELHSTGVEHPSQLVHEVAGAWVTRGNGQEHLTAIRSPIFTGAGACGAFWMAQDGIALRAAGFCNINQLFDAHFEAAQSIEVYKGPHSALYGGNAQYGGMNIRLPSALEAEKMLGLEASSAGFRKLHLGWQYTPAENHAAALWGTVLEDDGWREESGFEQQKITLKHHWQEGRLDVESGLSAMNLRQDTAAYVEGFRAYRDRAIRKSNPAPEAYRNADSLRLYSRWRWRDTDSEWRFTPYARSNNMEFLMHFVPWKPVERNDHDAVGWQLYWRQQLGEGSEIFWGQEFEHTWASLSEIQAQPAPFTPDIFPQGAHYDYSVKALNVATNVGGYWQATPSFAIEIGLRFDHDRYDYQTDLTPGSACNQGVENCRFYRPEDQTNSFSNGSAQLGFVHQLDTQLYWFGKLATGYRVPQATELYRAQAADINEVDSEKLISVELGLRTQWNNIFAQTSFFAMENRDGIIQDPQRRYINGVNSDHMGWEYEVEYVADGPWVITFGGTIAQHRYTNNPNLLNLDEQVSLNGNRMESAPKNMHYANLRWRVTQQWSLNTQGIYLGRHYLDAENTASYSGHRLVNMSLDWAAAPSLSLRASLHNLFDTYYAERADISFGTYRYFPGNTRTLTVGIEYRP